MEQRTVGGYKPPMVYVFPADEDGENHVFVVSWRAQRFVGGFKPPVVYAFFKYG